MSQGQRVIDLQKGRRPPWTEWVGLTSIAFGGSVLYGASLARAIPGWKPWAGAVWLTLSAGIGWLLLGAALVLLTRRRPTALAHACLVAMAVGEGVLACGAGGNALLHGRLSDPVGFNCGVVATSNVAMAAVLTGQLRKLHVPPMRTIALWLFFLDGGGAIAFWILYRVLFGSGR